MGKEKRKRARAREREKTTTTSVSSVASKVTHIEMWVFGLSAGTTKSCASSRLLTVSTSSSRSHDLTNGVTKTFVFRNKSVNTTTTTTTTSSSGRRTKTISRRVLGSTFERPSCVARAQTEEHAGQIEREREREEKRALLRKYHLFSFFLLLYSRLTLFF